MHPVRDDESRYVTGGEMKSIRIISLFVFSLLSINAFAGWDGTAVGLVKQIDVTDAENLGFRVYLKNASSGDAVTQCGTHTMAFLNKSSSNYQTYVSVLLAAKMSQTSVIIYTRTDPGHGHCHIGYIGLYDK